MSKSDSGGHEDKMLKQSDSSDQVELAAESSLFLDTISSDKIAEDSPGRGGTVGDTNRAVPGAIIGRVYRLESVIGTGGMGSVYKAVHVLTGQNVALKLLHSQHLDETSVLRFQKESKAISKLDHPHIAAAHYFDVTEDGAPFLAMDLVEGTSLSSLIDQQGRLSWQRAVEVAIQICLAVQHAHERGVIHRDLKPSNVLLAKMKDGADFVKIVDFGIAKVSLDDVKNYTLTETGAVLGTPLYMSPEQCRGLKLDSRTDIYSLGCVLYEMLMGQPPHVGQSPLDTIFKHINERAKPISSGPPSTLPSWPAELASIVSRALERDPQKRYQTMDELKQDLSQVLQHQPGQHLKLKARQPRSRKAVVVLLLAVAIIGFAISHVYRLAHWGDHVDKTATIPWQVISAEEPAESYLSLYQKMQHLEHEAASLSKDSQPTETSAMAHQLISVARQVSEHNQSDAGNACILAGELLTRVDHKTPQDEIDELFAEQGKAEQLARNDLPAAEAVQRSVVVNAEKFQQQIGQVEYEKSYNLLGDILYKERKYPEANIAYKDSKFLRMPDANAPYFDSDDFFAAVARRGDTYYELGLAAMSAGKDDTSYAIPSKYFELAMREYQRSLEHWQARALSFQSTKQAATANAAERDKLSKLVFNQATAYLNMARVAIAWRQFDRINHTEERIRTMQALSTAHSLQSSSNGVAPARPRPADPGPLFECAIRLYPQSSQGVGYLQVSQGVYGDYLLGQNDYPKALAEWTAALRVPVGYWSSGSRFPMNKSIQ